MRSVSAEAELHTIFRALDVENGTVGERDRNHLVCRFEVFRVEYVQHVKSFFCTVEYAAVQWKISSVRDAGRPRPAQGRWQLRRFAVWIEALDVKELKRRNCGICRLVSGVGRQRFSGRCLPRMGRQDRAIRCAVHRGGRCGQGGHCAPGMGQNYGVIVAFWGFYLFGWFVIFQLVLRRFTTFARQCATPPCPRRGVYVEMLPFLQMPLLLSYNKKNIYKMEE